MSQAIHGQPVPASLCHCWTTNLSQKK